MALTVKKFSPELQIKAKMDVFRIINELEFQNIRPVYQSSSTSDYVFPEKVTPRPQPINPIDYPSTSNSSEFSVASSVPSWTQQLQDN